VSVNLGCVAPHPPIIIDEIGKESLSQVEVTRKSMKVLAKRIAQEDPETLIIISPHSPVFADNFAIKSNPQLIGSLANFGAFSVKFSFKNDLKLVEQIISKAAEFKIPMARLGEQYSTFVEAEELDHGVLVPLYFISREVDVPIVSISISYLDYWKHYALGLAIQEAVASLPRRAVFIASGDLSHRLTPGAPAGYDPRGVEFDHLIVKLVKECRFKELLEIDSSLVEAAGECGLRSVIVMAGLFNAFKVKTEVYSYEGPFGVGYLVASVTREARDPERDYFITQSKDPKVSTRVAPVWLAKQAVENYIKHGKIIKPPQNLPRELLTKRAGVFVCLKKMGILRGCLGTISPVYPSLAEEIIANAVQAATADPRFSAVSEEELPYLNYSVDILGKPEEVSDSSMLDPKKYGVIVEAGTKKGLLLPDLEGVETVEEQLNIARRKAGILPEEPVKIFRFEVTRYCQLDSDQSGH
jgi:AmmeMemoRadiSam system protein A